MTNTGTKRLAAAVAAVALTVAVGSTAAAQSFEIGGKLLLTRGISTVEGAAGGGLVPWAFIAGNETDAGIGGTAHYTYTEVEDYSFAAYGFGVGIKDRLELSYTRQELDTGNTGPLLGLPEGFDFGQDIFGAKLRVFGNAVYDQDKLMPQIAVGVMHKQSENGDLLRLLGAEDDSGTEGYVTATKYIMSHGIVLNGTLRYTDANQTGLLGFGGGDGHTVVPEATAALQINRRWVVGGEYRVKPDNLAFAEENDWYDVFTAVAVNRHLTLSAAYVDIGSLANFDGQRGFYLSAQGAF